MSRVGKSIIKIPNTVKINYKNNIILIKGINGELTQKLTKGISCDINSDILTVKRPSDSKLHKSLHGLYRSLINNMIKGVNEGFTIKMELVGVGYRVSSNKQQINMSLGFSHGIIFQLPNEVSVLTSSEKGKNPIIILKSADKQLLGMIAAKIRSFRKPEPYKGKGIKFVGETIRRKAGKSVK